MDMYYYFSSAYPSAVKINGAFLGVISNEVKFCDIASSGAFIEICSLLASEPNVNFLLTPDFLSSPPENVCVTDLNGGFLIKCNPLFKGGKFSLLAQAKTEYAAVSVFIDNGLKVSIETPNDFFVGEIALDCKSAQIQFFSLSNKPLVAILFENDKKYLAVYSLENKIAKQLFLEIDEFKFDGGLTTTETRKDIAKHSITTAWKFGDKLTAESVDVTTSIGFTPSTLAPNILPYAFIEELLAGGKIDDYLTDKIKENADKLSGYLGEFIGVMPPPIFRDENEVGLIYKIDENKYKVDYFTFNIIQNKIDNIKRTEN